MQREPLWIVLARHGPVAAPCKERIAGRRFAQYLEVYRVSGLVPNSDPTDSARRQAQEARWLVCSDLRRARDSLHRLAPNRACANESLYREADLPGTFRTSLSLRPGAWLVLARLLWYVCHWPEIDSPSVTRERARRAASQLERLATVNGSVFLMGHGYFNALVAHELRRRGWRGPRFPNTNHWGTTVYWR